MHYQPSFRIRYADGRVAHDYDSTADACAAIDLRYPDYVSGHDGDLADGGDQTFVWACEADSVDDEDGARAVATIEREG